MNNVQKTFDWKRFSNYDQKHLSYYYLNLNSLNEDRIIYQPRGGLNRIITKLLNFNQDL